MSNGADLNRVSTWEVGSVSSTRQDTAAAIMRNARAAHREQLRNAALAEDPTLRFTPQALEDRVDSMISEIRRSGGRRGAASTRAKLATAGRIREMHAEVLDLAIAAQQANDLLIQVIREAADPHAHCIHDWPDDLGEDPFCQRCGLPYADYSTKEVAA